MTLYADILFLVNFAMNAFVLWVVSKAVRAPRRWYWILAGAAVMALLYTLVIVVPPLRFVNVLAASVIILAAGVSAAFHPRKPRQFLKLVGAAYVVTFMVGGLGMALYFLFAGRISWRLALAGMIISYAAIKFGLKLLERFTLKRQMLCNVQVKIGETDCNFDALVDTGHSLKEPLSQSPVIIAEFEPLKPLLPECLQILYAERLENDLTVLLSVREEAFYNRIRMIPFTSLGRNNGMLIGFRPDSVTVEGAKESPPDIVIGIYNDKLCRDGRYRGLLSPELVA